MESNRKGDNDHVSKGYKTLQYGLFLCLHHLCYFRSIQFHFFLFLNHNQHIIEVLLELLSQFFIKTSKNQSSYPKIQMFFILFYVFILDRKC